VFAGSWQRHPCENRALPTSLGSHWKPSCLSSDVSRGRRRATSLGPRCAPLAGHLRPSGLFGSPESHLIAEGGKPESRVVPVGKFAQGLTAYAGFELTVAIIILSNRRKYRRSSVRENSRTTDGDSLPTLLSELRETPHTLTALGWRTGRPKAIKDRYYWAFRGSAVSDGCSAAVGSAVSDG
jgi:hypothetical protein